MKSSLMKDILKAAALLAAIYGLLVASTVMRSKIDNEKRQQQEERTKTCLNHE